MQKKVLFGDEARKPIQDGVNKVADAVCVTLGPRGRTVIINKATPSPEGMKYSWPIATKDGVTVARHMILTDFLENTGALLTLQASEKTMSLAGDGTTSTVLLMQSILNKGMEALANKANPQKLVKGIEHGVSLVVNHLKKAAIHIGDDLSKIKQIATVSANNDETIGNLVYEAFEKIGKDGMISIEESKSTKTWIDVVEGFQINRGLHSPYFINRPEKQTWEMNDVHILLYEKKLYQLDPLLPLLDLIVHNDKTLLIICDDAEGEAMATIVMNSNRGKMKICIIKAPGFGDARQEEMEDLAALTNGTYISEEKGVSLPKVGLKELGFAKSVVVGRENTLIVGDPTKKDGIEKLISNLKEVLANADEDQKEKIERRIAKLKSGVAVMYVGGNTETEMQEKKDRCDDAIRATKAAISEGIVPGGGTAFLFHLINVDPNPAFREGVSIVSESMKEPLKKICSNAGVEYDDILKEIETNRITPNGTNANYGYNAKDDRCEDLVEAGIIDPAKVLRCSLEHAASNAIQILLSETHICDVL